ncbi:MAG TPA: adenylate/guanylate cyclase domain-containing protein [Saprospiraceae bacterium]|nr:adenylate/guanylate cyclase domain-containing protein [Saprospiraceae bacterium]HMQ82246.1 adenylate/guanylate cyclase domain-containing protein [Saprospiraceae bacterium]
MQRLLYAMVCLACLFLEARGQTDPVHLKVYGFDEGLSHRDVFKIAQDTAGYIWLATVNGLNRFDGSQFIHYNSYSREHHIPHDYCVDMLIDPANRIWLASPDYITRFYPDENIYRDQKLQAGNPVRRESLVPHSLFLDQQERLWHALYAEKTAQTEMHVLDESSQDRMLFTTSGNYTKRPIAQLGKSLYVGAQGGELWRVSAEGLVQKKYPVSSSNADRIVQLQVVGDLIYVLCLNGSLYVFDAKQEQLSKHTASFHLSSASALLVEENGDIWVGGVGQLLYYNQQRKAIVNYDGYVREWINRACTYRQIFKDRSGVIWLATNFGAIKMVQTEKLFAQYLSGGNEYCNNLLCSGRGIAEDEAGNIYFSYYNAIHKLDPLTDETRLLFADNSYFNYPFGLLYHQGYLYTGNGRSVDLKNLKVTQLFGQSERDLGTVIADKDGLLWFGYLQQLFQYEASSKTLRLYTDTQGLWNSQNGTISYLYQGKTGDFIWVGTLENGLTKLHKQNGRLAHYHNGDDSQPQLNSNQINAIYEDAFGGLWLGTAVGLHHLDIASDSLRAYTVDQGLPNNFINGILPEGDSCLWVSTDNGLCRFSIFTGNVNNYFVEDGLSANEFNRVSFYKASDGRLYFGGLDGFNAFYPGRQFLDRKSEKRETPILLTHFSKYDGRLDSLMVQTHHLDSRQTIVLHPSDRFFSFEYALADYRQPQKHVFSYMLEGYDKDWSPPGSAHAVRYNNVPAGTYTFRVRAKSERDQANWNGKELAIQVVIEQAFYKTWWFFLLCVAFLAGGIWSFMRYRIYLGEKRERDLSEQVKARTAELEAEKQKSEELLLNILPLEMADELKQFGAAKAKRHDLVTVMFSDFKGFSIISEQMTPEALVAEIDFCYRAFDEITDKYGLEKIKTIGDAYLCVGGIRNCDSDEALRVILAALEIQAFMEGIAIERGIQGIPCFEARIGIHTGPVIAGIVGIKKFAYDIWGATVNLASRMETYGEVGRVNISGSTYELVKPYFQCQYNGVFSENGSSSIDMYLVEGYLGD